MAPRHEGEGFESGGGGSELSRAVEAYWIRLDVDYDEVWWMRKEPRFVKDAFPNLIRYVRMMSVGFLAVRGAGSQEQQDGAMERAHEAIIGV